MDESQAGPLELTGLLASGLKMARRSGERGLLSWHGIAGAIVGDMGLWLVLVEAPCRGAGTAAWRRREGARWRWGKFGEGRAASGSVGLSAGEGLCTGRSGGWVATVSIWSWAGCLERSEPKPFLAA